MCDPKPGARCSADTRRELIAARGKLEQAQREVERDPDDAAARRRLAHAEDMLGRKLAAWESAPEGQRHLAQTISSSDVPDSPSNDDLRTRLYIGRRTRIGQKKALARVEGKTADEESLDVNKALNRLRHPDGGFTRHPETGREETLGFFVSRYPERERAYTVDELRPRHIREFREANADLFAKDGHFMGGWHDPDTGLVSLDVSVKTESAEDARSDAAQFEQVAFYDAQMGASVNVNTEARGRIADLTAPHDERTTP